LCSKLRSVRVTYKLREMTKAQCTSAVCTVLLSALFFGCTSGAKGIDTATPPGNASAESYTPGLGEIMTLQQMRHTKLWLAGSASNWDLAAYEIDELGEGFDDVIKFHPTHEGSPVAPKDAIPRIVIEPLKEVGAAVEKKDSAAFASAYDKLTEACNSCHEATNFGFNVVQRPANNPYPNQVFTPRPHSEKKG
jgi:hypothetical protein